MKRWRLAGAGLTTTIAIIFFVSLRADAVELIADINQGTVSRPVYVGYRSFDTSKGSFLPIEESSHGIELWFSDNTPQGTRLVKDIYPGNGSSVVSSYAQLGENTVFLATDGTHGVELWRSDGTTPGTFMLADIGPGPQSFGGDYLTAVVDGVLYFAADDGLAGNELWRTDGTREGTYLAVDIVPGFASSYPASLAVVANRLFFHHQDELWISDGTPAGTRQFVGMNASTPWAAGNKLFFAANDGVHGRELWRADFDGNNLQMVANINDEVLGNQDNSSDPEFWFKRGESVIFMARTPNPTEGGTECRLFRADANGTGVTELVNLHANRCGHNGLINLPAGALFGLSPASIGGNKELWVSDGTLAGTMQLDLGGVSFATNDSTPMTVAYGDNGEAYFFAQVPPAGPTAFAHKIWRTDGTRAGTRVFADLTTFSKNYEIAYLNGRVYFDTGHNDSHAAGDELWTSDGTTAGTFLVRDINIVIDSSITNLRAVNGRLQFFATGVGAGREPWSSDGTLDGTINLITTNVGGAGNADSNPEFAGQLGSRAVFAADRGSGNEGHELHITDGTSAGTAVIRGLFNGGPSDPENFLVNGDQILFVAGDAQRRRRLWRTDGTSTGTIPLEVLPSVETSNVLLGDAGSIIDGVAYFTAAPSTIYFQYRELWRTDGTAAGTFRVPGDVGQRVNILGGNGTHVLYQALLNGSMHLWSWNGSQAQIIAAAEGLNMSSSAGVTFGGRVCFRAWDVSPQNLDVWCANGLAGDVLRVTNFSSAGASSGELHPLGSKLLVNVSGAGATNGLFVTQGSAADTQRISAERILNSKPFGGQQMVFVSESGKLMLTDGTSGGTRNLLDGVSLPGNLAGSFGVLGNFVVFVVNDATRGAVVWRTDGTPAGTRYLADLDPGTAPAQSGVGQFFTLGDRLLFSAYRTSIGNELWSINANDPNASDDAAPATGGTAITVNALDNDADFDGTLNVATVVIVTQPAHGTATVNATTGAISYTATTTYSGTDTLTYRVSDDQGRQSNVASISFMVTAGATPPPTTPPSSPPASGGGGGGGGALGLELCGLLAFGAWAGRRRRRPDIG